MTPMLYDEWAAIGLVNGWLGVRANDPTTSTKAAATIWVRAGSQRELLLSKYAGADMTDEEAGHASGLAQQTKCCYWKRCSELRANGYIVITGTTRIGSAGSSMMVCAITPEGLAALD